MKHSDPMSVRDTIVAIAVIAMLFAFAVFFVGWKHTNDVVNKDHQRWCTLLTQIQRPKSAPPTTKAAAHFNNGVLKLEKEFHCNG